MAAILSNPQDGNMEVLPTKQQRFWESYPQDGGVGE